MQPDDTLVSTGSSKEHEFWFYPIATRRGTHHRITQGVGMAYAFRRVHGGIGSFEVLLHLIVYVLFVRALQ
jgi:hypothetical protein